MKRVEAVVRVERLQKVKERLRESGIGGIILHASIWSKETEFHLRYRGLPVSYSLVPAAYFELAVPDDRVDSVVSTIKENARTGEALDGVISVSNLESYIAITSKDE